MLEDRGVAVADEHVVHDAELGRLNAGPSGHVRVRIGSGGQARMGEVEDVGGLAVSGFDDVGVPADVRVVRAFAGHVEDYAAGLPVGQIRRAVHGQAAPLV